MKFLPLLVLFLLSSPVLAQSAGDADPDPASMTSEQMLVYCQQKWGSRISAVAQCVTKLRFGKSEAVDSAIVARLDEGEERDGEILERLDKLGQKVDRLARPAPTHPATAASSLPPQAQTTSATSGGNSYARTGGVAWTPVVQPTVVSIHSLERMANDTLHLMDLDHPTAREDCGGVGAPLVVFFDHGVPITNVYAPAGASTSGFVEVYWDRQNNGIPDGTIWALDLSTQTDVWITWGLPNDLEIRYLRPGGQIAVEGLPLQTVYHPTVRAEASASGAIGCDRDPTARRGGHQAVPAYSLSRMW
ncbi:MAG: hypothetical protein NUV84_01850 [Candidatus Uhrbacteria bacterium]|nr:hypothetical protein [Candidatus Uhrbacteria bacterium]